MATPGHEWLKVLVPLAVAGLVTLAIVAAVVSAPEQQTSGSPTSSASHPSTTPIRSSNSSTSSGKSFNEDYIITDNASRYLPNGFVVASFNLNSMHNGSTLNLGGVTFKYVVPPTTVTTVINGTTYTEQIDYICSSFFYAQLPDGKQFLLDDCRPFGDASRFTTQSTIITTASTTMTEYSSISRHWSMWELSNHTLPRVGIHVEGSGNDITAVELVVGSISSVGGKPSCSTTSDNQTITCVAISDSVTESCTTLPNSISCQIIMNGTAYQSSCSCIRKGGLLFFHVVNDSGAPLQGVPIGVEYTTPYCPGITIWTSTQQPLVTNASGWALYDMQVAGTYSFTINGRQMEAILNENNSTYVTIRIPSYNVTTVFRHA